MLINYLTIAFRSLIKNKVYSLINVSGLAAGIAVTILILLFAVHEMSFDRFHLKGDRIVRAEKQFSRDGRHSLYGNPDFGPEMLKTDSRVENYVRLFEPGTKVVKLDERHKFFEDRFIFADTSYFSIFSFPLVSGTRQAISVPFKVIISEKAAQKYFGTERPEGKTILYDKDYTFEIVGVAKEAPGNSSLQFDFIASFASLSIMPPYRNLILENSSGFPTYLLLRQQDDLEKVNQSILKTNYSNASVKYSLAPLFENHFNLNFGDTSNIRYVYIFLSIAGLILALAIVNYMNLTTARATTRAKEIGIRKIVGARNQSIAGQFYLESAIVTLIAFVFAMVAVEILMPSFLNLLQLDRSASFLWSPLFLSVIFSLLVLCIILSGSYPALVLSRFKPATALRGQTAGFGKLGWSRKAITIFQFAISIGLIVSTLIMQRQLNFLKEKKIGIERDQVLVAPMGSMNSSSMHAFKNALLSDGHVLGAGMASVPLFKASLNGVSLVKSPAKDTRVGTKWIIADEGFLSTLGISFVERSSLGLSGNHIVNETAAQEFGLPGQQSYDLTMGDVESGVITGKIAGVVKDFNYQSLRKGVAPMVISVISDTTNARFPDASIYIHLAPDNIGQSLASVKNIYEKFSPDTPFTYYFLDDAFDSLQKGEARLSTIFSAFTAVGLSIACLGLLGLITFNTERKTREIGIRKILGASRRQILGVVSGELLILTMTGIAVGCPIAWLIMNDWLKNFFYQTDVPLRLLIIPAAAVILISLVLVCVQGMRTASENPANSMRSE